MPQQQETVTDRLVSIIQTIQLRRGTGVLMARRGEGITTEEGTIVFANGQATEAKCGRRKGTEALNNLSTWGNCLYRFVSSNPQDNVLQFPVSLPNTPPPLPPAEPNRPPSSSFTPISPLRRLNTNSPSGSEPNTSGELGISPGYTSQDSIPHHSVSMGTALQFIEGSGLSRTHRQVFLLISGQRSIAELMRLTGRSYEEIHTILQDLERANLIHILSGHPPQR
ncbi:MAG TPA: DUF4388 domain-containing protein [Ktedonosporobacter sp.]|nr:DUF4388 domain-containing protein [Ktedonosporobacter sp.]